MAHHTRRCQYSKIRSSIGRWCVMLSHSLPARSLNGREASLRMLPEGAEGRCSKRLISRALLAIGPAISGVGWIFLPALRETAPGGGRAGVGVAARTQRRD